MDDETKVFILKEIERYEIEYLHAKKECNTIEIFYNEGAMNSLKDLLEHVNGGK
jgi:hypothetical protein